MSESYSRSKYKPWQVPPLTIGQILAGAVVTGFKGAVVLSLLLTLIVTAAGVLQGASVNFLGVASLSGWLAAVGFVVFFLIGILLRSRPLQDRSFRVTGFVATFFGLAVLVYFFWGLLSDVASWLHYTPILVAMKNEQTIKTREELKNVAQIRAAKKAELEKEYQEALAGAADEAEKKEITKVYKGSPEKLKELQKQEAAALATATSDEQRRKIRESFDADIRAAGGVFADNLRVLDATIADSQKIASMPLRDTSVWAVLHHFLLESPSNEPEAVGIRPALFGSLWLALITILFAVPIGTGAALYLEEYKHSGRLGYWIQVNINNLAGVPSIVFGIMGAFVFVELIFKPLHRLHEGISVRNLLGGGLTLGLLTLPVIIVAAQEAIRAVPNSIRQGAYALGATHWQVIWHQILPLARPGIMTGTILAVSRAIGEAAPLVLFGATTFIAYSPNPFSDFTVLPIQIYNWAERPDKPIVNGQVIEPWSYNMALASLVLLVMLILLNAMAIYLRNRAQKKVRW
jgi:phosphate transport system permease protein